MYDDLPLGSILFLDVECVSGEASLAEVDPAVAAVWREKAPRLLRRDALTDDELAAAYRERAGIYAEYGRVVCVSVGVLAGAPGEEVLRVKSFADPDEGVLLGDFAAMLAKSPRLRYLCGHNVREFDLPYLGRRMLVHRMPLPRPLDLRGKKPWEVKHVLDTMEMWTFGDRKSYTSLKLLAALFGVPSPKDDIDGSQVGRVYWDDNDLDRIAVYCERDVVATANVFLALSGRDLLPADRVALVDRRPATP